MRYDDARAAIKAAIQLADPSCPATTIWDRYRDPKSKSPDRYKDIFQVTSSTGGDPYIHAWHFDRRSKTNGQMYATEGPASLSLDGHSLNTLSTSDETWEIEALRSWVDDGPNVSTYIWQEMLDGFQDVFFNSVAIQNLERTVYGGNNGFPYNYVLKSVSISDMGIKYLGGEMKCHVASITLAFSINY